MRNGKLNDTSGRYGLVSRLLHWVVAYLVLWQLLPVAGWSLIGAGRFMRTVRGAGPNHGTAGFLVALLIGPRFTWAVANRRRRPPAQSGLGGRAAWIAHRLMYLLTATVALLPLLRAYGSGDGLTVLGIRVIAETGVEHATLIIPADLLHKPLAYALAALIALHVAAALWHGVVRRDGIVARMTGPLGCRSNETKQLGV